MITHPITVEQIVRHILSKAIEDGLVGYSDEFIDGDHGDPSPQARSAGELTGVANLLSDLIRELNQQGDVC